MNFSYLSLAQAWHVLGWTMILFLAAGTVVFLIGGILRIALKRANPRVRYATSLAVFAVLAITPLAIAGYLVSRESERVGDSPWRSERVGDERSLGG